MTGTGPLLAAGGGASPGILWTWPFIALLLAISILPLLKWTGRWWHHNSSKLLVALLLGAATLTYYYMRGEGALGAEPGLPSVLHLLEHAVLREYVPFMTLLLALYVISGGVLITGDIRATPLTNTAVLALGSLLASVLGTTGASMVLIRPLLRINSERKITIHTFVFFIFLVSNIGGSLLPIGDPPLFLGYLRGVPFLWTLGLWPYWAALTAALLVIYLIWDVWAYRHERAAEIAADRARIEPLRMRGSINFLWLLLVIAAVATLSPNKAFPGTQWHAWPYLREIVQFALIVLSLATTPAGVRKANEFDYAAIGEVACLFIGIFITMQTPIEILHARAPDMAAAGFSKPWHYFWVTGLLSSFLDNAPTYVVFFETANQLTHQPGPGILRLVNGDYIREDLLVAISCGAVFMGANTYIGNGPNFMVKSICERAGVKMPSFVGYMGYAGAVLIPVFIAMTVALAVR